MEHTESDEAQRLDQAIEAAARASRAGNQVFSNGTDRFNDGARERVREALRDRVAEAARERLSEPLRNGIRDVLRSGWGKRSALLS